MEASARGSRALSLPVSKKLNKPASNIGKPAKNMNDVPTNSKYGNKRTHILKELMLAQKHTSEMQLLFQNLFKCRPQKQLLGSLVPCPIQTPDPLKRVKTLLFFFPPLTTFLLFWLLTSSLENYIPFSFLFPFTGFCFDVGLCFWFGFFFFCSSFLYIMKEELCKQ